MPELNWLDLGAATAARTLLLRALTDADGPAQRLAQGRDGAALHDFRVALRRLRTTERAYRSSLGESGLPKKLRRRLRRLVRDTGAARDAEVHLALLAGPREILRPHQRAGLRWFEQHLHARLRREDARLRERLRRDFPRLRNKLETHLRACLAPGEDSFAAALTGALRREVQAMLAGLSAIGVDVVGQRDIHRPRLSVKRARYLLVPVTGELTAAPALLAELEAVQDHLGELHDLETLGNELRTAAAALCAKHARQRVDAALDGTPELPRAARELAGLTALAAWLGDEQRRQLAALQACLRSDLIRRIESTAENAFAALDALPNAAAAAAPVRNPRA